MNGKKLNKQKIMNFNQKITFFFFIIIFSGIFYISGIYGIFSILLSLFFYSLFFYFIITLFKKIKNREFRIFNIKNYLLFLQKFLYRVSGIMILFIIFIWSFSYYQNEINPAKMPIFTISNWEKIVVFQAMSHIWTFEFYQKVKDNIIKQKNNWYVLYFEWVREWSKKNQDAFNKALWIKFDQKTYENVSKLYWLINQDNEMFLWLVNDLDYNVDISIDEIMEKYNKLKIDLWVWNRTYSQPIDISQMIIEELAKIRENELKVLRYINKSFVNLIIKNENLQSAIQNNFANKELFDVILNKRNEVIAKKIISWDDKKIIAIYWLLHFKWVYEILKSQDIKWQIKEINYLYPLK